MASANRNSTCYSRQLSYRNNGQWNSGINGEWVAWLMTGMRQRNIYFIAQAIGGIDWDSYYYLAVSQAGNATVLNKSKKV